MNKETNKIPKGNNIIAKEITKRTNDYIIE